MLLDCNSEECLTARASLEAARNEIISLCGQLEFLKAQRANATALAAIYGAMAAAAFAIVAALAAIPFIGLLFAGLLIAGALFLILQGIYLVNIAILTQQIRNTETALEAARKAFQAAVSAVMKNCPSECWGDLVMPAC